MSRGPPTLAFQINVIRLFSPNLLIPLKPLGNPGGPIATWRYTLYSDCTFDIALLPSHFPVHWPCPPDLLSRFDLWQWLLRFVRIFPKHHSTWQPKWRRVVLFLLINEILTDVWGMTGVWLEQNHTDRKQCIKLQHTGFKHYNTLIKTHCNILQLPENLCNTL